MKKVRCYACYVPLDIGEVKMVGTVRKPSDTVLVGSHVCYRCGRYMLLWRRIISRRLIDMIQKKGKQ